MHEDYREFMVATMEDSSSGPPSILVGLTGDTALEITFNKEWLASKGIEMYIGYRFLLKGRYGNSDQDLMGQDVVADICPISPPLSYLNIRRLPVMDALRLEGGNIGAATESLIRKGYFSSPPRPWSMGIRDRGMGRKSFAVLDRFGDLVVETGDRGEVAEFIVDACNAYTPPVSVAVS